MSIFESIFIYVHTSKKYKLNFDIAIVINFIRNLILLNNYQIAILEHNFHFLSQKKKTRFFFFFFSLTLSYDIVKNIRLQKFIVKYDIFSDIYDCLINCIFFSL